MKAGKATPKRERPSKMRNASLHLGLLLLSAVLLWPSYTSARATIDYPIVQLRSLDKITARTQVFEAEVGKTIKFGSVFIKVQACRKAPELEQPESAAFLQIWETPPAEEDAEAKPEWIFSGWMFASSPGLSAMDHPIYDVWVLDCLERKDEQSASEEAETGEIKEGEGVVEDTEVPEASELEE